MVIPPQKTFAIEGERPRLVCDFIGLKLDKKVENLIKVDGRLIKAIRVGIHLSPTPKIRVVLDRRSEVGRRISDIGGMRTGYGN